MLRGLREDPSPEHARELAIVSRSIGQSFLLFGIVGPLIGGLQLLFHIGETGMPEPAALSRACAVMLLALLYALTIQAALFQPLTARFTRIAAAQPPR